MNYPITYRLKDDLWFQVYQDLLLAMTNTDFGRDLLGIKKHYPRITYMGKECLHWRNQDGTTGGVFRIGSPWGNLIRQRFDAFRSFARYFQTGRYELELSPLVRLSRSLVAGSGMFFPDPDPESTTYDGDNVNGSSGTFSVVHDAASGDVARDANDPISIYADKDAGFWNISRGTFLFNVSSAGSGSVFTSGTLSLYVTAKFDDKADARSYMALVTCTTLSDVGITNADYPNFSTTKQATDLTIASLSTSAYNVWTLNATGLSFVSPTGITHFGMREGHDLENTAYSGIANEQINVSSADHAGTGQDPELDLVWVAGASTRSIGGGVSYQGLISY